MDPGVLTVVVLGVALFIAGLIIVAVLLLPGRMDDWITPHRGHSRTRALTEVAESKGLHFDQSDDLDLSSLPLDAISAGTARRCRNILSSNSAGHELMVFDLKMRAPLADDGGVGVRSTMAAMVSSEYTCALAKLAANCPMLKIIPFVSSVDAESDAATIAGPLLKIVGIKDPEFEKSFKVFARDPGIVSAVLSPTMREWLREWLQSALRDRSAIWNWEIHDAYVLAWTQDVLSPVEAAAALDLMRTCVRELPDDLDRTFPLGPTEADRLSDDAATAFRDGKISAEDALATIESAHASADSIADRRRYEKLIAEVTAARVDAALARSARGTEI